MAETVSSKASADGWNEPTKNLPPLEVGSCQIHCRWETHRGERDPAGHGARLRRVADLALHHHPGGGRAAVARDPGFPVAVLPQHGDRTLHPGDRRDRRDGLQPFLETLGSYLSLAILPNASQAGRRAQPQLTYLTGWVRARFPGSSRYCSSPSASYNRLPCRLQHHREGRDGARRHHHCLSAAGDIHSHRSVSLDGDRHRGTRGHRQLPRYVNEIGIATILGAIAFAGAGGANNLCQSNYIRDKGMGMGVHIPRIVSPSPGRGGQAGHRVLVPGERGEPAPLGRLVEGRQQGAAPDLRRIGLLTLIGLSVLARLGPWRGNLRRSGASTS